MRTSKLFLILAGGIFSISCVGIGLLAYSLYRNVDDSGARISADLRIMPLVATLQEQFREAESAEQMQQYFHALETAPSLGSSAHHIAEIKQNYAPLLAHLKDRPKDLDSHATLLKKKDFLDATLNFYRKEVQKGDIQVRAALLNIIFDTHSSFLGETPEMEMVYLKKCKEKVAQLKAIANEGRSPGIGYRINGLETLLSTYEKAATQIWTWNDEKKKLLVEAEKASTQVVSTLKRSADVAASSARRDFLQNMIICAIVMFISLGLLYFGSIKFQTRFDGRARLFKKYFENYGQDKLDTIGPKELGNIKNDSDWGPLFQDLQESEEKFIQGFEAQRAISQFNAIPFVVTNRSNEIIYWNSALKDFIGVERNIDIQYSDLNDLVNLENFGQTPAELAELQATIERGGSAETVFKNKSQSVPIELIANPIDSGKYLNGGRVILFRQIPREAERIAAKLQLQVSYVETALNKIVKNEALDESYRNDALIQEPVKKMIVSLSDFKLKTDERETLWKTEIQALMDQVIRQKEILEKVGGDLKSLRERQDKIGKFFAQVYETERVVHTELVAMERNLQAWDNQQNRLQAEVGEQLAMIEKAREYESAVRNAAQRTRGELNSTSAALTELQNFKEEVRLKALNLSLGREPGSETFAARVRAYAAELEKFCHRAELLVNRAKDFIDKHPGNSLFAGLESTDFDASLLEDFRKGQVLIGESVSQWRGSTDTVLQSGIEVQEILHTLSEKSDEVYKLNETCLVINERAKENLGRWN